MTLIKYNKHNILYTSSTDGDIVFISLYISRSWNVDGTRNDEKIVGGAAPVGRVRFDYFDDSFEKYDFRKTCHFYI